MREHHRIRSALFATAAIIAAAAPSAAWAQTRSFNVQAQPAASGVAEIARQADAQIMIAADDARGKTTNAVLGEHSTEDAIRILLAGTGLVARATGPNTYSVFDPPAQSALEQVAPDTAGVPDILVTGRRAFSLNTGIERTRDDAQPFVVFDQEQIRRTGATNLEQFLNQQLTSNASRLTSNLVDVATGGNAVLGRSRVDLRGLGSRETLILVDGRRQPGINNGSGEIEQPVITNIPLASIERIEVLASSAAGIYGVGATGGVINIVLRRDYEGGEIALNYADTTDIAAADGRIDLTLGKAIEGGRTNLTFTGSYRRSDPLTRKEREDLLIGGSRFALANNPRYFNAPPLGSTANIASVGFVNLTLDPIFGGGSLGSDRTFLPEGFRGIATDGVASLIANAGQYNLSLPNVTARLGTGGDNPVLAGSELLSGTLGFRREMNSWLRIYGELAGSRSKTRTTDGQIAETTVLAANSPFNPFQQAIRVTVPIYGIEEESEQKTDQLRVVGGAIAKLGGGWQAVVDAAYGQNWYSFADGNRVLASRSIARFNDGMLNPLRDSSLDPFVFEYIPSTLPERDNKSDLLDVSLKVAGPLPITLPGGKPIVSLNVQRTRQNYDATFGVITADTGVRISYTPDRSETIISAYGEIRIPLIGDATNIPLVQELEITAAGRYEQYKGRGSNTGLTCFESTTAFPEGPVDLDACDPDKITFPEEKATNSHFDPTIAVRWKVIPDLTLRASYATGYLPPRLSDLIRVPTTFIGVAARDPERGNEIVGTPRFVFLPQFRFLPGFSGGNPDLDNEESESLTAGAILTPRFLPGLRVSVDYTRIEKKNNFANPSSLLETQETFLLFLERFPERVTRGPTSGGFAVGPITSVDVSRINIAGTTTQVLDFAADYGFKLGNGTLDIAASASHNLESSSQAFEDGPEVDASGVVFLPLSPQVFSNGAIKWRGVGSVRWSNDRLSVGWRGNYYDGYYFNLARTVELNEGSARLRSQFYQDIFASYRFDGGVTVRAGVNNFLDRKPPYVDGRYSTYGDPRLANFYINVSKAF